MLTEYGYLVVAANEMHLAYIERHNNPDKLAYAANLGCNTFRELLRDEAFFSDVAKLAAMRKSNEAEVDAIIGIETNPALLPGELTDFQNFLYAEKQILVAGGLETGLVETLIDEGTQLINQIRSDQVIPEHMRAKVERLRRVACKLSDSLRREHNHEVAWGNLRKLTIAAGGCAIVGLNASSVAATFGLSAPAAAISNAIGCALVGVGTTIVIQDWFDWP